MYIITTMFWFIQSLYISILAMLNLLTIIHNNYLLRVCFNPIFIAFITKF